MTSMNQPHGASRAENMMNMSFVSWFQKCSKDIKGVHMTNCDNVSSSKAFDLEASLSDTGASVAITSMMFCYHGPLLSKAERAPNQLLSL